jgi:hypothetical protein
MAFIDIDSLPKFLEGYPVEAAELDEWFAAFGTALDNIDTRNLLTPLVFDGTIDLDDPASAVNFGINNARRVMEDMISAQENGVKVNNASQDAAVPLDDLIQHVYTQNGGGKIYLGPGDYYLNEVITHTPETFNKIGGPVTPLIYLPPKVHLVGAGPSRTRLLLRSPFVLNQVVINMAGRLTEDFQGAGSVSNLAIVDDGFQDSRVPYYIICNGRNGVIKNVQFKGRADTRGRGILFAQNQALTYGPNAWIVEGCTFESLNQGIDMYDLAFAHVTDSSFYRCSECILMEKANQIIISGCDFNQYLVFDDGSTEEQNCVALWHTGDGPSDQACHSITVSNCLFRYRMKSKPCVRIKGHRAIVTHNSFTNMLAAAGADAIGVIVQDPSLGPGASSSSVIGGNNARVERFGTETTRRFIRYLKTGGLYFAHGAANANSYAMPDGQTDSPIEDAQIGADVAAYANLNYTDQG